MLLILVGTFLLMLPEATYDRHLGFIDSLFTSASAVCVTGLTIMDTGTGFTLFGKVVLLCLIQIGGLGIMAFSTLFLMFMGKTIGLTGKMIVQDTYTVSGGREVLHLLKEIFIFTAAIETIGAAFLFWRFSATQQIHAALFNSIFHAVSAFCNAGFSLYSDSFSGFRGDAVVNLTICLLIIFGGIGFVVLSEIRQKRPFSKRRWATLSLHTKIVLSSTLLLLLVSTLIFTAMEWHNTPAGTLIPQRLMDGFFQAVNARTAGFNSLPINHLTNGTLLVLIILMFIGTAPGSCGGGVKVTTFTSLLVLGVSRLRGKPYPQIFYRRISEAGIGKAISVVMISMVVILLGIVALQQTEIGEVSHQFSRGSFMELVFEAVSAFGTVGLSMGITPALSTSGKLIITVMMYIGRLGPVAVAMALSRQRSSGRFHYAEENIMIG